MERHASAIWHGGMKEGRGQLSTESGALNSTPYSFKMRFGNQKGTNPEELVGAAHSGCFSMALSGELEKMNLMPDFIRTKANVEINAVDGGWAVTHVHLDVAARIPNANQEQFQRAADIAKANCPISKLLKAEITMSAHLETAQQSDRPEMTF